MKTLLLALVFFSLSGCISREMRAMDDGPDQSTRVVAIAFRGASTYAPENTFAAFDKAQELGAVGAQADVQLTKDDQVVVFAGDALDEKTSLKGAVNSKTWAELSHVDLAPWFAKQSGQPAAEVKTDAVKSSKKRSARKLRSTPVAVNPLTRIILLDELLERYGMTFSYNLALKSGEEKLPEAAIKVVRERGLRDNVTFTSFDVDQLTRIRQLDHDISICYLIDEKKTPDIFGEIMRAKTLGFTAISIRASAINEDYAKKAREVHLKLYAWGVQSDDDARHAVASKAVAITTKWPDQLMKILQTPQSR